MHTARTRWLYLTTATARRRASQTLGRVKILQSHCDTGLLEFHKREGERMRIKKGRQKGGQEDDMRRTCLLVDRFVGKSGGYQEVIEKVPPASYRSDPSGPTSQTSQKRVSRSSRVLKNLRGVQKDSKTSQAS